jgi:hypothetical protein
VCAYWGQFQANWGGWKLLVEWELENIFGERD